MMLSKSKEEFMKNSGWSSNLFFPKIKILIEEIEKDGIVIDFGRTVAYLIKNNQKLKLYVHHNGRSKEYLTITNAKGDELKTFHYQDNVMNIINFIKTQFV